MFESRVLFLEASERQNYMNAIQCSKTSANVSAQHLCFINS